jgi:hypothetical protein
MRSRGFVAMALGILVVSLGLAANGWTQDSEPEVPSNFAFTPEAGPPGTTIQVSGNCPAGGPGSGSFVRIARIVDAPGEEPFDAAISPALASDGSFTGNLQVPDDAPPDRYTLGAECNEGDAVLTPPVRRVFHVTPGTRRPSTSTTVPGTLPRTG